jgi:pimeloyl-ACP methyl ester carboxylesterase
VYKNEYVLSNNPPHSPLQNVYFISGLGADSRAFLHLDLSFCIPVFVKWLVPTPNETIAEYARRMKEQITDENPVIVGLSFGGMIAIEIAKLFPVKQLILLSSAKTAAEIPFYLRLMRYLPLHKAFTPPALKYANYTAYRLMGVTNRKDKSLFTQMFRDADNQFISWAINQIIHWKNNMVFPNTIHIHGTADIMLPHRFVRANHSVKGGAHLMVILKAREISSILRAVLQLSDQEAQRDQQQKSSPR